MPARYRQPSTGLILAMIGMIVVTAVAFGHSGETQGDLRRRSREFTRQLYEGIADSLPEGAILDLGGAGDTVLVRWFLDRRRDSPGREWPRDPLVTLEGRDDGQAFLARLTATYGPEFEMVDDGLYACYYPFCELPNSFEYTGIARLRGRADETFTVGWLWVKDSLVGGWIIPSRRAVPSALGTYEQKTTLRLPFDDEWVVLWGGPKPHENYHVALLPRRFASDFVVDSAGSLHRSDGRSNADYYCFGRPIVAPAAGQVAVAVDSFPENTPGTSRRGYRGPGNVVTVDHGGGEVSVLAHLRRGSVRVAVGQKVATGDIVGECGNNGESTLPHLHYQLQLSPQPGQRSVPVRFSNYLANSERVASGTPTRGQRVVHATRR